jgi:hypothetical protein
METKRELDKRHGAEFKSKGIEKGTIPKLLEAATSIGRILGT